MVCRITKSTKICHKINHFCIALMSLRMIFIFYLIASGAHPMPGGVFPPPPAASHLLTLLPPPDCFHVSTLNFKNISQEIYYLCTQTLNLEMLLNMVIGAWFLADVIVYSGWHKCLSPNKKWTLKYWFFSRQAWPHHLKICWKTTFLH